MTTTEGQTEARAVQLSNVSQGARVRLDSLQCGRGLAARLRSMGLRVGVEFSVVKSGTCGPLVVAVGNSRFALGWGMAHKMTVVPVEQT